MGMTKQFKSKDRENDVNTHEDAPVALLMRKKMDPSEMLDS